MLIKLKAYATSVANIFLFKNLSHKKQENILNKLFNFVDEIVVFKN